MTRKKNLLMISLAILLILNVCISHSTESVSYATHEESLNLHLLKTNSDQSEFNHLVEHVYRINAGSDSQDDYRAPGIAGIFFDKLKSLTDLRSFRLSFSLGNLPYEEEFSLPHQLPRFGSFLVISHKGNPKELVEIGFLLGSFFGLANGRITAFEKLINKEQGYSWYSYAPEQFCVDQLYKVLKFYPNQDGLHKLITEGDTIMFRYGYASVEIVYTRESLSSESLKIILRTAIPDSQINKVLALKFRPLSILDPRNIGSNGNNLVPKIRRFDHYQEKWFDLDINQITSRTETGGEDGISNKRDSYSLSELLALAKKQKITKHNLTKSEHLYRIDRFVRGRISSFNNTLIHLIKGGEFKTGGKSSDAIHTIKVMAVSDSHQHFFLSDIKVRKLSKPNDDMELETSTDSEEELPFKARYITRCIKPNSNLPITVVEVSIELRTHEAAELSMPYLINLRKLNEYEHEYERGTYLIGSIATVSRKESGEHVSQVIILPPLLTNEKIIDSTFAFTTLTINNVIFFILPITIMFLGISMR